MEIVKALPPNYEQISKRFHFSSLPATFNPVFAWGDKIYNPTGHPIPKDIMIHEEVHQKQQEQIGLERWWEYYLTNDGFRLEQEVEAYRVQYKWIAENSSRNVRREMLQSIARDLSSALYGNIIKKREAEALIANYA